MSTTSLVRYRPYAVLVAVLALVVALPARHRGGEPTTTVGAPAASPAEEAVPSVVGSAPVTTEAPRPGAQPVDASTPRAATAGPAPRSSSAPKAAVATAVSPTPQVGGAAAKAAPDCDTATGRIKVASIYAPPCVAPWPAGADNGGATSQGVTATTIKVVAFTVAQTPGDDARQKASWADYVTMFEHVYRMWGRHIETVWFERSSGSDEASQRADAIKIAGMKPFAVVSAGTNITGDVFAQEVASRGILVMPFELNTLARTKALSPYLWGINLASPESYELNVAEYLGKRLIGKPAKWSGQPDYQVLPRKVGMFYPEEWDISVFNNEFSKYGGTLTEAISFNRDVSSYQERARTIVARMKSAGITTIIDGGSILVTPIVTKEATAQQWFPEWFMAGYGGNDLDLFGRIMDPAQWQHAFGMATFPVGGDKPLPADQLYDWYWGASRGTRSAAVAAANILFSGIHGAGPKLTPQTFRDAMFAMPAGGGAASGGVMSTQVSYGRHGFFPWDDYNGTDDFAEVWWDPTARGKDIVTCQAAGACADGVGKYRYLNGGQRHPPSQWPRTDPTFFDPNGTALWYSGDYPPGDAPPKYPCTGCPSQSGG